MAIDEQKIMALPRFVVLQSVHNNKYLRYVKEDGEVQGYLQFSGDDILSPFVKFEVDMADSGGGLVNLRSCYNNKYWACNTNNYIVATANEQVEDTSNDTCTLFIPIAVDEAAKKVQLMHAQSECYTSLWKAAPGPAFGCLFSSSKVADPESGDIYTIIVWSTLLVLPKYVAFEGTNNKYLKPFLKKVYLQFKSDDKGEQDSVHEVIPTNDGYVRVKSVSRGVYWRHAETSNWIVADTGDGSSRNPILLFWPVKLGNNTIALRSAHNNKFCGRSSRTDSIFVDNCLIARPSTISQDVTLQIEELVLSRDIYNVRFRLNDARIYNKISFVAASSSASNRTNNDNTLDLKMQYEDSKSSTWSHNVSVKAGVKTTIETGIPCIAKAGIEVSFEASYAHEWGETKTQTIHVESTYTITVPAKSKVVVNLMAMRGTCDVPFSYSICDRLYDGRQVLTRMHDGLYTGANYFDFNYDTITEDLP